MFLQEPLEGAIEVRVPVQREEGIISDAGLPGRETNRAAGAKRKGFGDHAHAKACRKPARGELRDLVGHVAGTENDVPWSLSGDVVEDVREKRPPRDIGQDLRPVVDNRAQAGTQSSA
jgi:hypothetical protein